MMEPVDMDVDPNSSDDDGRRTTRKSFVPSPCSYTGTPDTYEKLVADLIEQRLLANASRQGPSLKVEQVIPLLCESSQEICEVMVLLSRRMTTMGPETNKPLSATEREVMTSYLKNRSYPSHLKLQVLKGASHAGAIALANFLCRECRRVPQEFKESLMGDSSSED